MMLLPVQSQVQEAKKLLECLELYPERVLEPKTRPYSGASSSQAASYCVSRAGDFAHSVYVVRMAHSCFWHIWERKKKSPVHLLKVRRFAAV